MRDEVNRPRHYQFERFQAIDVIEAVGTLIADPVSAQLTGNVLKYVMRWPRKHGARDLKKARWYLDRLIERLQPEHKHNATLYDPASVAFRHGDIDAVCGIGDVAPRAAVEIADSDGAADYGNPTVPGCAKTWGLP